MNSIKWKNASPELLVLWDYVSGLIGFNTITPITFFGIITGSEFLTYNAGKVYLALEFGSVNRVVGAGALSEIEFYDMANALMFYSTQCQSEWAIYYEQMKNIWFSRIVQSANTPYIKFIGYRLTV